MAGFVFLDNGSLDVDALVLLKCGEVFLMGYFDRG